MTTRAEKGKVYLIGAGPGDPGLLTVRAASLLQSADEIYHDGLIPEEILKLAHSHATVTSVGKRCGMKSITQEDINQLLVRRAQEGYSVVRLKIGDPLLFGRAGEEMDALATASIPFEVVPGITAGFAAAAAVRLPLTDRRHASRLLFLTGHSADGPSRWGILPQDATLVIYMPGTDYRRLSAELVASGLGMDTPCVVVSAAGTPREASLSTTVAALADAEPLPAPCVLLVGSAMGK